MIDINLLRQQPDTVRTALINRQKDPKVVDDIISLDTNRRQLLSEVEKLRSDQNILSRQFKGKPTEEQIKQASEIKDGLKNLYCQENNLSLLRISYKDSIIETLEKNIKNKI